MLTTTYVKHQASKDNSIYCVWLLLTPLVCSCFNGGTFRAFASYIIRCNTDLILLVYLKVGESVRRLLRTN